MSSIYLDSLLQIEALFKPSLWVTNQMQFQDRFIFDAEENILFIDLAELRIESREQVDEMSQITLDILKRRGRRSYGIVNYEGTEIAPEIMDYYGERIKEIYDRYSLTTVRYSSSGLTRSVLRYLGAAIDLESNIFATRDEALRAIQELKTRSRVATQFSARSLFDPRLGILGKLTIGWLVILLTLLLAYLANSVLTAHELGTATLVLFASAAVTSAILFIAVVKPLGKMEELARRLSVGGVIEPVEVSRHDEVGQLARTFNDAAIHVQQEIERLSGLYHISLMMGTGAEVSQICELLTRKIARLLGAEMCIILLYDEQKKRIHAQLPAYGINDERLLHLSAELEEKSIATEVFRTREPYLTNNAAHDPLIDRTSAEMVGVRQVLAVPLKAGEHMLGTLEVINKEGGFLEEEKRLVTIFASQAAHLLQNAQLFEQVRESEERYRQIFESAVDGLYRSTPEGYIVNANPTLAAMLGYETPEELNGVNLIRDLFIDQTEGSRLFKGLAESGQVLDVECDLHRRSGETVPTRISVRAVMDGAGGRASHLGIVKDVTEQKRLAQQLIVSERLAVVGEMVAGVAHEVRNPLCGITITLSALSHDFGNQAKFKPYLDAVTTEVDRLNYLMEQLLEHSRPLRFDDVPLNVRDLINEAIGDFSAQALAKGVSVSCNCSGSVQGLRLDRRKMHGVFTNLIENALQHSGSGGQVLIAIHQLNGNPIGDGNPCVRIQISDTGSGIAPQNLNKIFEPFFTTRPDGIGLGLAIVQKTIHDHGGVITARSDPGQGATFIIDLPT